MYWAVAQTEPRREHIARLLLMREGYETYAPRIRLRRKKIALLFPSYLFVRIVERWYPVLWTPGISRVLMWGEIPARLPDVDVDTIKQKQGRDGLVRLPRSSEWRRGDAVMVTVGLFAGHLGLYEGMSGQERSRVLLNLLGGRVSVELPSRNLATRELASSPCVS